MITKTDLVAAAAVNDRSVLANCLARSPDIANGAVPLRTYEGYASAASAYNAAIDGTPIGKILILAHQDVYLPAGWADRLVTELNALSAKDPAWAVAGLVGIDSDSVLAGHVWSTGLDRVVRGEGALPAPVAALDELLLIVRTSDRPRFDPDLPGFHLYGVDIIQQAAAQGRLSYAIDAPAVHHDKVISRLDRHYRKAWRYMRRKLRDHLPIPTLIAPLTASPLTLTITELKIMWWRRGIQRRVAPASDPREIARSVGFETADAAEPTR